MANIFLNGFLQSSDPAASVDGSNASDLIEASGALSGGRIRGLNGDDTLVYNLGGFNIDNSLINGNDGADDLFFGEFLSIGDVFLRGTSVFGGAGDDSIFFDQNVRVGVDSIVRGDDGDDTLEWYTSNFALFNGNAGDDFLYGGLDDTINETSIFGGIGNDTIWIDNNTILTNSLIRGDDGDDSINIFGGSEVDNTLINGNAGADTILIFATSVSNSSIFGGIGDDFIDSFGTTFTDALIRGDEGADFIGIDGSYENTLINGNADDDVIVAFAPTSVGGTLTVRGGIGDDTISLDSTVGGVSVFGDDGNDVITSSFDADTIEGGEGADTFFYFSVNQSSLNGGIDQITDFVVGTDVIDWDNGPVAPAQIINGGEAAALDQAGINGALGILFGIFGNNAGTFSFQGSTYLVLNEGGAGYQAGTDILIDITGIQGNVGNITIV